MDTPLLEESDGHQCRICLSYDDQDSLIAPCRCSGTARWVHRGCLDEWRAQERVPLAFTQCPTCKFNYRTRTVDDKSVERAQARFRAFVARDACGLFALIQGTVGGTAYLMHVLDADGRVASLYPKEWARANAELHLAIGPYYVSAIVLLLALLGLVGEAITRASPQRCQAPVRAPQG